MNSSLIKKVSILVILTASFMVHADSIPLTIQESEKVIGMTITENVVPGMTNTVEILFHNFIAGIHTNSQELKVKTYQSQDRKVNFTCSEINSAVSHYFTCSQKNRPSGLLPRDGAASGRS